MALLRAAALPTEGCPAWLPTHVQVTVVRARGLRCKGGGGKGKAGGSDAYTVIQLGREKYSTSVAEKSGGSPEWREECAFELPPEPAACAGLLLTVMHRALVGMDRFLGQALVPLEPGRQRGREPDERWHKLHSKAGKKEKERGEILVSIQFTRNSLTASMFDLSIKDKPRSAFGKLKDKVTGRKKYELESASAIIPSSMAALDGEDDLELGDKKSRVKGFFLRSKLRKSSLSQSNTSLGSDSTISSASLSLAGSAPEGTRSPSRHGSLSTERSGKELLASPRLSHRRAPSEEQRAPREEPGPEEPQPGPPSPPPRSSLCINGSHVYGQDGAPGPALPQEPPWGLPRAQHRDEPRFIPSPPSLALQEELKVSTKAVTLSNHLGRARMEEGRAAAAPGSSSQPAKDTAPGDSGQEDSRAKGGSFHPGGTGTPGHSSAPGQDRSRSSSWFGPRESPQKPSLPPGPRAVPEVAGSFYSSEDCSPSASPRRADPEGEPPAQSIGVPVPETSPPAPGELPPADSSADSSAQPVPTSEWDDTFDAFATSRLKPERKKENFFGSVAAEGMAFIDDGSPTQSSAQPPCQAGFEQAESPLGAEIPAALRSWTNFSSLDVGANLVSTTQEATVIEDVLSPVSMASRRKSSTPTVWAAGDAEAAADESNGGEEGASGQEQPCSAGTNGWMTIATESAAPQGLPFLPEGAFESSSRVLPRSSLPPEAQAGSTGTPEPGTEPAAGAGQEGTLDIRSSVFRLQAGEGLLQLSSHIRQMVLAPWPAPQGHQEPPPKPPRWFAAAAGDSEEGQPGDGQPGKEEPWERSEGAGAEMGAPRSPGSSEPSLAAPPSAGANAAGAGSESQGARAATVGSAAGLGTGDTSVGEHKSEMNETDVAEQFETCTSKLSLDGVEQSGAEESWSQPRSPPETDSAPWEAAPKQQLLPEELRASGLKAPSQAASWAALEEQEAAGQPQPPRSERRHGPSQLELACRDGEGPAAEQEAQEPQGHWADSRPDFKKADFWKPDRAEERHTALRNPFTLTLSPISPSNPFMEKPPSPLPIQAVLPKKLEQEEPPGFLQPTNASPLHVSQPLASSSPFPVAATNPEGRVAPVGIAARRAPPCPQPLPRDTRPAEEPLGLHTTSPHPVKPLSAVQEGSSQRKQQPRASLSSAFSNGLERLKAVSSVQPVAPACPQDCSEPKEPAQPDQSARYYHLTHDELIQLLLQKEGELSKKQEHIQELENYIDQLLVRIMEQSPTLLQIPLGSGQAP
ncbi:rab11 family-interacting protein 5 isoform X2 [Oenanthe melanoleuca]|uniref:rab11 family-interacting protein 5 isoform X2 n=1 Tax=Oenanthe melanoleuca TaxID=2939378 RepID=UPI0024C1CA47|nr:rab11 family-interacting protein 5 isoform X2 [Oenanthe melanoleuca]